MPAQHPQLLSKLIAPILITSIGAGLIMPFMNVFFRQQYGQPDPAIGTLFAWGSLAMGIGLIAAPPLAERMGKIQLVVVTQALSIPFLILLGFSPWYWLSVVAYLVRVGAHEHEQPDLPDLCDGKSGLFGPRDRGEPRGNVLELRLGLFANDQRVAAGPLRLRAAVRANDPALRDLRRALLGVLLAE